MKILSKYIIKTIFISIAGIALMWVVIFSLFDFLADSKNIGVGDYLLFDSLFVLLLNAPILIYKHLIVIILIGVILALGHLASTSQLIVARSIGFSIFSISRLVISFVIFLYILIAIFGELVAPSLSEYKINYKSQLITGTITTSSTKGFWLKDGNKIISVVKNYDGKSFAEVDVFTINNNKLSASTNAKRMAILGESAILGDVKTYIINGENLEFKAQKNKKINLLFDEKLINSLKREPVNLSIIDIYKQVKFLSDNELNSGVFKVELYKRLIKPFILIVTILFSMLFIFGSMRNSSMGKKLFLGIAISLVLELYLRVSGALSLKFGYNYLVIVLLPLILFLITTIKLLANKK